MGDKVTIVKLNIDENPETARAYRVMSVPTLTVFKDGQPVQSVAGAKPKGDLVRLHRVGALTSTQHPTDTPYPLAGCGVRSSSVGRTRRPHCRGREPPSPPRSA